MTEREKETLLILHNQGESYKAIAETLNMSINTVKTVCRRYRIATEQAAAKEKEQAAAKKPARSSSLALKPRQSGRSPGSEPIVCKVTVSYAETDSKNYVRDVLSILSGNLNEVRN